MVKKIYLFSFTAAMVLLLTFTGWMGSGTTSITDHYYYKDAPFHLKLKNDRVFLKLKENMTQAQFNNIISGINNISAVKDFDEQEKRFFIELSAGLSETSIISITEQLKAKEEIVYASPVFSQDNGTSLIGVQNEIMVQFREGLSSYTINNYLSENDLEVIQELGLSGGKCYLLKTREDVFAIDIANTVYKSGLVNWSEPNLYFTNLICYTPNDTYYPQQWSLRNIGNNVPGGIAGTVDCDMDVDSAWDVTLGHDKVIVAVSDTGCDTTHPDLAANFIPGSGYDFYNNDPWPMDDHMHGTACAGEIAAINNNNTGVAGIAGNSRIIPIKWLSASGNGDYTGAVNATNWGRTQGAWVISNSWGFVGGASSALDAAITDCANLGRGGKGTLFVVASGNENGNNMRYPSNTHQKILSVGGISPCNQRKSSTSCDNETTWGSSYGNNLHVVAPCVKVYTTTRVALGSYISNFNGTSSATPNAAGVCALMFALDSNQTWDSVRVRILRTCEKRGTYTYDQPGPINLGQWNLEMGYGLINAYTALKEIQKFTGPYISHSPLTNTEDLSGPYPLKCEIFSTQSPIDTIRTKVYWRRNTGSWDSLPLAKIGENLWYTEIPGNDSIAVYDYYIKAMDSLKQTTFAPGGAPSNYYTFEATSDSVKPVIVHTPLGDQSKSLWPPSVNAVVTDAMADFGGVDSVWVKWYKNNPSNGIRQFRLNLMPGDNYTAPFNEDTSYITLNDSIHYRIFAQDNSFNHNIDSTELYGFKIITGYNKCIGSGSEPAGYPFYTFYMDSRTDILYTASEIGATGNNQAIKRLAFNVVSQSAQPMNGFKIKMQNTTLTSLNGFVTTGWSTVYDTSSYAISGTGLQWIELQTPFPVDPTKNLLIEICFNNNSYTQNSTVTSDPAITNMHWHRHADLGTGDGCIDDMAETETGGRPNICFYIDIIDAISTVNLQLPKEFRLSQNYPNPFNPVTTINYAIPKAGNVTLTVFDITGREVARLVNGEFKQAGTYNVSFDASNLASGMYLYRIESGSFVETKKMVLIK